MDKETVILKYEKEKLKEIEENISEIEKISYSQEKRLKDLKNKLDKTLNKNINEDNNKKIKSTVSVEKTYINYYDSNINFEDLYKIAEEDLQKRGLSINDLDYNDLISEEELKQIEKELDKIIPKETKWNKSDFIVVFIASIFGSLTDIILSDRNNNFTGKDSVFEQKIEKLHRHEEGAPIDYQGKGFGGGYHRGLSRGHDPLRFIEGIKQFKNGTFEGIRYENGKAIKVISKTNQYQTPYEQLSTIDAIIRYMRHILADFCSSASLPFPGFTFLSEANNRDLRIFAADMYTNGFNCKNIVTQSLSTIIIEIIIRIYFSTISVKEYKEKIEIDEKYSNIDTIKEFINPNNKDKLYEMLLVSHSIVSLINTGKITIKLITTKDISSLSTINITEIISVVRYGIKVTSKLLERNNIYNKTIYYSEEINNNWDNINNIISELIIENEQLYI